MWTCPKCKRQFKAANQSHYCAEKPKSIAAYIDAQDAEKREDLLRLYDILRTALPEAEERMSWSMPTFWKGENIVHFAASKAHMGFYVGEEAVAQFAPELGGYKADKGTIRIPYGKIDPALVTKIAKWCWKMREKA